MVVIIYRPFFDVKNNATVPLFPRIGFDIQHIFTLWFQKTDLIQSKHKTYMIYNLQVNLLWFNVDVQNVLNTQKPRTCGQNFLRDKYCITKSRLENTSLIETMYYKTDGETLKKKLSFTINEIMTVISTIVTSQSELLPFLLNSTNLNSAKQ